MHLPDLLASTRIDDELPWALLNSILDDIPGQKEYVPEHLGFALVGYAAAIERGEGMGRHNEDMRIIAGPWMEEGHCVRAAARPLER